MLFNLWVGAAGNRDITGLSRTNRDSSGVSRINGGSQIFGPVRDRCNGWPSGVQCLPLGLKQQGFHLPTRNLLTAQRGLVTVETAAFARAQPAIISVTA